MEGAAFLEGGDVWLLPLVAAMKSGRSEILEAERRIYEGHLERGVKADLLTVLTIFAGFKDRALVEELLRRCEAGDKKLLGIVKKLVNWCIQGFKTTYATIGIKFDEYLRESKFIQSSKRYVRSLIKKGVAKRLEDGAVLVELEKYSLPNKIILRSDGTGLYLTRDIAASLYKKKKYKPSLNIYVVGEDQKLHFKQQFKILELLGHKKFAKACVHLSYSYVTLPSGKMSSRLGNVVLIDDVFEEVFTNILTMCVEKGMVSGHTQTIDSAPIKANASMDSLELKVPKEDLEAHLKSIRHMSSMDKEDRLVDNIKLKRN